MSAIEVITWCLSNIASNVSNNVSYIAILNIKGFDYSCIISGISKSEVIKLMQNTNFNEKSGIL